MRLAELVRGIEEANIIGVAETEVTSIAYDSRRAGPGCMFVAVKGAKADGAAFIADALKKGAAAVACEDCPADVPSGVALVRVPDARRAMALMAANFYGRPSERMRLVGITGTNGKTTTSYLVRSVIESTGAKTGLIGTISYSFGGHTFPAPNTTPESVDLQKLLAEFSASGATHAVMEVSSHAVSLDRIAGCGFAVKVFTNFTQDHLDFHGGMDEYYAAKKGLFTNYRGGVNVINMDDPKGVDLAADASGPVMTYAVNAPADVTARDVISGKDGVSFTLVAPSGETEVKSRLAGRHNVYNILAAAGACLALGIKPSEIAEGTRRMHNVPGRFERVEAGQDFTVLVDYAHTEDALAHAISAAREFTTGRVITLFGCGGDRDRTKRAKMGRTASLLSDLVVLTSDNPRTEDPAEIIREAEAGIVEQGAKTKGKDYFVSVDRGKAVELAVSLARPGDTVLLAGKGHEDYQIIGATKYHFDDREAARAAILKRI